MTSPFPSESAKPGECGDAIADLPLAVDLAGLVDGLGFDDFKSRDAPEFNGIEGRHRPATVNRRGRDWFGRAGAQPGRQVELRTLVGDEERGVEDQPHGFLRGFRAMRPLLMAAANSCRSSAERFVSSKSSASSWLLHPGSDAGTR